MHRKYENAKFDTGCVAKALNNTNVTGPYFRLGEFRSVLAILSAGAAVVTKTTKIELLEAKTDLGGSSQALTGAEATITSNTLATEMSVTLATVLNTETIIINGLTFTAHTDTTTVADRKFKIDGNDGADAIALAVCINDPTYGVPGILATVASNVVTLTSINLGATLLTITSSDATFTILTISAQAYIDIEGLKLTALFTHIAVKVTTTANTVIAVVLVRYDSRKKITQKVGASYPA